ncbi:E3 ubiquitin-protein ligase AIP2 [Platanthera guangdongensis]|uniref:E3 ubiquitin-protein ligase AIP2 n=1 Tax=Platanthera guangdongensis TaxID=2320717 RepID=A0ABR2LJC1_9ASPA
MGCYGWKIFCSYDEKLEGGAREIYSTVCRVATLLQTRYTTRGFWLAGLSLFEQAEKVVTVSSEKDNLNKYVARAREHLNDMENEVSSSERRQPGILPLP